MKSKSLAFKIFKNNFFVGTIVYIFCASIFMARLYSYFEEQIFDELEAECDFLISGIEVSDESFLSKIKSKNRITLVDYDGNVLFDNQNETQKLENHLSRTEILTAKQNGSSKISRYSNTMLKKTLYFARRIENPSNGGRIVRISCDKHSIGVLVFGMSQILLLCLVIALIISGILSAFISKKIADTLNRIDLDNPEKAEVYDEIKPFTTRIAEENFEKKQREELRQQFSANVSHELKTPLTSISGFAEIMKNGGIDEKTMIDFSTDIYNECQRMILLVNDIIKLSKLDELSITLEKEEINLFELMQEIIENLKSYSKKRNVIFLPIKYFNDESEVDSKVAENLYSIHGVHAVIYEMLYNLCDNAIKYSKPEGGNVEITLKKSAGNIIFKISDNGIGIPQNQLGRIFERFYRVDKSRSKNLGGTGLGLSIVKHGAKYHDAKVSVQSQVGAGSVFEVKF